MGCGADVGREPRGIARTHARLEKMAAGLLSLFPDLAAKNTFRIAGKDFRIAGKEDMTLILGIIMAMSWP